MNNAKFIISGGYIGSQNDEDIHYISATEIVDLYGIKPTNWQMNTMGVNWNWIELKPDYYGNYNLAETIADQIENHWMPIARKNAINEIKEMTFWERLKFTFTGKLQSI